MRLLSQDLAAIVKGAKIWKMLIPKIECEPRVSYKQVNGWETVGRRLSTLVVTGRATEVYRAGATRFQTNNSSCRERKGRVWESAVVSRWTRLRLGLGQLIAVQRIP